MSIIPHKYSVIYLLMSILLLVGAVQLFWTAYSAGAMRPGLIGISAVFVAALMLGQWRKSGP
jgi:hypothetical protein